MVNVAVFTMRKLFRFEGNNLQVLPLVSSNKRVHSSLVPSSNVSPRVSE